MTHPTESGHEAVRTIFDTRSHTTEPRAFRVPPAVPFTELQNYQQRLQQLREELKSLQINRAKQAAKRTQRILKALAKMFPDEGAWQNADKADMDMSLAEDDEGVLTTFQAVLLENVENLLSNGATLSSISPREVARGVVMYKVRAERHPFLFFLLLFLFGLCRT